MSKTIWLIAGTSEGRILAEQIAKLNIDAYVSVATEYGANLLSNTPNITVLQERMTETEMEQFLNDKKPALVIDATHPYATLVTANVQVACENLGYEYIRLTRSKSEFINAVLVKDFIEAVEFLNTVQGNVFLTTGSKNLQDFTNVINYQERIALRILPMVESLEHALNLCYKQSNIICMQGPFSEELNVEMFKKYNSAFIVTKDSGDVGGLEEKIRAAEIAGAKLVIIERELEAGSSLTAILELLEKRFS